MLLYYLIIVIDALTHQQHYDVVARQQRVYTHRDCWSFTAGFMVFFTIHLPLYTIVYCNVHNTVAFKCHRFYFLYFLSYS